MTFQLEKVLPEPTNPQNQKWMDEGYQEARKDFHAKNPHEKGSIAYEWWQQGFDLYLEFYEP